MSLFGHRRSAAEKEYDDLVAQIVSTPALSKATHHTWTMATEPHLQTKSEQGTTITFHQAEYAFTVDHSMRKVFEDAAGRAGYGRIVEHIPDGATVMYWEWDQGLEFPRHFHAWSEHIVFIKGLWRLEVNGVISVQPPGSSILIPGGIPHSGAVLESSKLLTISIPNLD